LIQLKKLLQTRKKMPLYTITASRETFYEFQIEAESEGEAITEANRIEVSENVEDYAYDWMPLEIIDVTEDEAVN
jgi:hypothetical protein